MGKVQPIANYRSSSNVGQLFQDAAVKTTAQSNQHESALAPPFVFDSNLQAPVANAQPIRQGSPEEAGVQVDAGRQTVLPFNVPAPPSSSVHSSTPTRAVYPGPRATINSLKRRFDQAISDLNNETTVARGGAHAHKRPRTRARMEAKPMADKIGRAHV